MSMAIDGYSAANMVNTNVRAASRSIQRMSSGTGRASSKSGVKVQISVALLNKSREMNEKLATGLLESLPGVK